MRLWLHKRVQIGVLGPLRVTREGQEVALRGQRLRDLLALLLVRGGRPVPPDVVRDALWDGQAPAQPGAVHTVVARLRRTLGAAAVETAETGYRLGPRVGSDVDEFLALTRRAGQFAAAGDPAGAAADYRAALDLWRGPLAYDGVSDELVTTQRTRLDELRAGAAEGLARALLQVGGGEAEALRVSGELIENHPLREGAHVVAMEAAYRAGRPAQATDLYRALQRRLREELGVEPAPATQQLYQRILRHDPSLATLEGPPGQAAPVTSSTSTATPASTATPVSTGASITAAATTKRPVLSGRAAARRGQPPRLPRPLTATVGRAAQRDRVLGLIADGHRLVTLVGPGGVGKSRLLAVVGAALADLPADGRQLAYVDLSGLTGLGPDELAESVAVMHALPMGGVNAVDALVAAVIDLHAVVLVDEAEWVADAAAELIREVLQRCPRIGFVVTSRMPLGILGEVRVELEPLALPTDDRDPTAVAAAPAVRLLSARLADVAPELLVRATATDLARLATSVDGLPLALELLAGHATHTGLRELLELARAPLELRSLDDGHDERHRSLRETLRWSVDRLDATHAAVLRQLGVFNGSCDLAAARAVVSVGPDVDVQRVVGTLAREGLVQMDRGGDVVRMRLLRTVRDYCRGELAARGEQDATARRHRQWFATRWRGAPLHDELIADVVAGYHDYLDALRAALTAGEPETAVDLALTLNRLWLFRESPSTGLRWLDATAQLDLAAPDRARLGAARAGLLLALRPGEAVREFEAAVPALTDERDGDWLGHAWIGLAIGHYLNGDYSRARDAAGNAVEVTQDLAPHHAPEAWSTLAAAHAALGEGESALRAAERSWELACHPLIATTFVSSVVKIGLALIETDHYPRALDILRSACELGRARLGLPMEGAVRINCGWAALMCEQWGEAADAFGAVLGGRHRGEGDFNIAESMLGSGCLLVAVGHPDATTRLADALILVERAGLHLSPWQQARVNEARSSLTDGPPRAPVLPPDGTAMISAMREALRAVAR